MFDVIVRDARCVSSTTIFQADIGILKGKISALGRVNGPALDVIEADGRVVTPGGVDSHVHIDQRKAGGRRNADDFRSGTISAACGGTTTVVPFAPQLRGDPLEWAVADYRERASKAVIDYNFHIVISDPSVPDFETALEQAAQNGLRSVKIFTTYPAVGMADSDIIKVFAAARRYGLLVMAHCENADIIDYVTKLLVSQGKIGPRFHLASRPSIAEAEAVFRICSFAELFNVPTMIVHVSTGHAVEIIKGFRARGATVFSETCTQYLTLEQSLLDAPGSEGAKGIFSPPLRDAQNREALWAAVSDGDIDVLSSDHSPYRFDESGKFPEGRESSFDKIASGVPGVEVRMPLLYTRCVQSGKMALPEFVRLTSTNAARIYGLREKGDIAVGMDADLCIWDDNYRRKLSNDIMHHNVDFTPYEGIEVTAWPALTISRGAIIARYHDYVGPLDRGRFIPAVRTEPKARPTASGLELSAFSVAIA